MEDCKFELGTRANAFSSKLFLSGHFVTSTEETNTPPPQLPLIFYLTLMESVITLLSLQKCRMQFTLVTIPTLVRSQNSSPPSRILIWELTSIHFHHTKTMALPLHSDSGSLAVKIPNRSNILHHLSFYVRLISHAAKQRFFKTKACSLRIPFLFISWHYNSYSTSMLNIK